MAAYSGDNEPLEWAISSERFGSIQTSINVCDQHVLEHVIPRAQEKGMGVIAKRPLANSPWRYEERPSGDHAAQTYWDRWQKMALPQSFGEPAEIALRFVAYLPGVHSCLAGTRTLEHLKANLDAINKGPLPEEIVAEIRSTFRQHGRDWISQV